MKLLSKNSLKHQSLKNVTDLVSKEFELTDAINRKVKDFNLVKSAIEEKALEMEKEFELKEEGLKRKCNELLQEVEGLEEKKREALKPLTAKEKLLQEFERTLNEQATEQISEQNKLALQAKTLQKREAGLLKRESELLDKEKWAKDLIDSVNRRLNDLETTRSSWEKNKELEVLKLAEREKSLLVKQKEIEAQAELNVKTKDSLERLIINIENEKIKLQAQRQVVQNAFDEARRRNLL